jgi:perosamine synthetase
MLEPAGRERSAALRRPLPYGRHAIDDEDIAEVVAALRSEHLTTGPRVADFERALAAAVGAADAVAVSSGTAALHAAMHAARVGPGDEVIVPALTFVATANAVLFQGATPVFADVDPETLLLDPEDAAAKVTPRTRALVAVDYAGQPCEYERLRELARGRGLCLIADACHSLGANYRGTPAGALADLTAFSFHPVKAITTGEGGAVTTASAELAARARRFRNHGLSADHHERAAQGTHRYEMVELGSNYRLSDLQCALGLSQLRKLPRWAARRRALARAYDEALAGLRGVRPQRVRPDILHAYHLYVVRLENGARDRVFAALRARGIGVNVHYLPVHLHRYYRERFGTGPGLCPAAERAYEEILSLPLYPAMSVEDVKEVVRALAEVLRALG